MLYTYRWYYVYVRLCFLIAWRCQSGQQSRIAKTGIAGRLVMVVMRRFSLYQPRIGGEGSFASSLDLMNSEMSAAGHRTPKLPWLLDDGSLQWFV